MFENNVVLVAVNFPLAMLASFFVCFAMAILDAELGLTLVKNGWGNDGVFKCGVCIISQLRS